MGLLLCDMKSNVMKRSWDFYPFRDLNSDGDASDEDSVGWLSVWCCNFGLC